MKNKVYIAIMLVSLALTTLVVTRFSGPLPKLITNVVNSDNHPRGKLVTGSAIETFSGTITAVDTGCFYDATCSVSVDGKKVILVTGGRGMSPDIPVGRLIGAASVGDLEQRIGDHANVYAAKTANGDWTLYGKANYYVEVVTLKK